VRSSGGSAGILDDSLTMGLEIHHGRIAQERVTEAL
jgi:hypothetical protein